MHESALEPSRRLGGTPLFLAEGTVHTVDDAIRWGVSRGLLARPLEEARVLAAAAEADVDVDENSLQEASERFRYERDLITAGETEAWLQARGMTIEDFGEWLTARLVPAQSAGEDSGAPSDFFRVHLWLSGGMEELSRQYSRSIAAEIEARQRGVAAGDVVAAATTDAARMRKLAALTTSLMRVEVETLVVDSEAAGREAILCVKTDRQPLDEVAREAGYRSERSVMWIDDVPPAARQHLLGARIGDAIGPIADDGRFTIYQLLHRQEPRLDHGEVKSRIDQMLVDELFADLCARHIHQPDAAHSPK